MKKKIHSQTMRTVFASTTAFLSEEFLTKFEGEKLDWTLSKVAEKSGVKINRINNNISVAGLWPWVLEAHGMLLSDFMGLHRLEDLPDVEEKVEKVKPRSIFGSSRFNVKRARAKTYKVKPRPNIPEPVIYYEYRDPSLVSKDVMSPSALVDVVNSVTNPGEAASLKKIIKEKYKKSREVSSEASDAVRAIEDSISAISNNQPAAEQALEALINQKTEALASRQRSLTFQENTLATEDHLHQLEEKINNIAHHGHPEYMEMVSEPEDMDDGLQDETASPSTENVGPAKEEPKESIPQVTNDSTEATTEKTESEPSIEVNIKVEKTDDYPDEINIYDGDTDDMTDKEANLDEDETPTRLTRSKRAGRRKSLKPRRISKRKAKPVKYTGVSDVDVVAAIGPDKSRPKRKAAAKAMKRGKGRKKGEFMCNEPDCIFVCKSKQELKDHKRTIHGTKFKCDHCEKTFGISRDRNRHIKSVHHEERHFCIECNKYYKTRKVYEEHLRSHLEGYVKPVFECEICHRSFSSKYNLATHIKAEHLGMRKSFMCPTCGRTFTQKNSYRQHANVHAGIKPYVCDQCGKAFSYEKSLKEHKFIHDGIRRFQCPVCQKYFLQSTSLRIHIKIHNDTRDHICSTCGKGFTQKQALIRHERLHTGDKPFTCSLCAKTFSDYSIIRRHMILIHKKDPKQWQESVVSHVKPRKEYYINGGPGPANVRKTQTGTQKVQDLDEAEYVAEVVDNAIRGVIEAAEKLKSPEKNPNKPKQPHAGQYKEKSFYELENFSGLKPVNESSNHSTGSFASNTPFMAPPIVDTSSFSAQNLSAQNTAMPLNYSMQPALNFSPIPTSAAANMGQVSQDSAMNRYQPSEDVHIRDLQRAYQTTPDHIRSDQLQTDQLRTDQLRTDQLRTDQLRTDQLRPDQLRSQLQTLHYPAPVTSDQSQTLQTLHGQAIPNQWSLLGYPPYYNPNFAHFQGPPQN